MLRRRGLHAPPVGPTRIRQAVISAVMAGVLLLGTTAVFAVPSPPTNGGNGAGQSGQCTGPQDDRPAACKSQGGPGG